MKKKSLTLSYSIIQCFNWGAFAAIWVYVTVILKSYGMTYAQAGIVTALANAFSIIIQLLLSSQVDRCSKFRSEHAALAQVSLAIILAFYLLIRTSTSILSAGISVCCIGICITGIQPFLNTLAMEQIRDGHRLHFGLARGIGSVTYAAVAASAGFLYSKWGTSGLLSVFIVLYLFEFVSVLFFTKTPILKSTDTPSTISGFHLLKNHLSFSLFLVATAALWTSYMLTITYTDAIVTRAGGTATHVGILVAVGAVSELPAMIATVRLMQRFSVNKLLLLSGIFFCVRSLCILASPSMPFLYASWALQSVSYGLFTPLAVFFVNETIDAVNQAKGQAMSFGATTIGCILGNYLGGRLTDNAGITFTLLLSFVIACSGLIVLTVGIKNAKR